MDGKYSLNVTRERHVSHMVAPVLVSSQTRWLKADTHVSTMLGLDTPGLNASRSHSTQSVLAQGMLVPETQSRS